jgi:hypothetical protein
VSTAPTATDVRQAPPPSLQAEQEAQNADRRLGSYALLTGTFTSAFVAMLALTHERLPDRFGAGDLALISIATHKLSRLITRDRVTRPLRAPFTDIEGDETPNELRESARGRGLTRAIGELLSCPFCLDQWIAAGFLGALIVAPRPTRATASLFAVVSGSDYLQFLQVWVREHA